MSFLKKKKLKSELVCFSDKLNIKKFDSNINLKILKHSYNPFLNSKTLALYLEKNKKNILGMPLFFNEKGAYFPGFNSAFKKIKFVIFYIDTPALFGLGGGFDKKFLTKIRRKISIYFVKIGVKRSDKAFAMTKSNAKELKDNFKENFKVFYLGSNIPKKKNLKKKKFKKTFNLLSVSRIDSFKNIDWLVECMNYFVKKKIFKSWFKNIKLNIIGNGPDKEKIIKSIKSSNLSKSIKITGFINDKKLENFYKNSDLSVIPAIQGYGLPALEALYRKIPVVINKKSGVSEIFKKNPWVKITNNNKISFRNGIIEHIKKIYFKLPSNNYLKELPTSDSWILKVGIFCNWWKKK